MKVHIVRTGILLFLMGYSLYTSGQGGWIRRTDVPPGAGRGSVSGASAGNKGYLLGGTDRYATHRRDALEYDQATDTWKDIGNVPGYGRAWANAYSLAGNVYFGLGHCQYTDRLDCPLSFYKYDPVADTFSAAIPFVGCARVSSGGFTIGSDKIYVCGGQSYRICNPNVYGNMYDIWEYNTTLDIWTKRAPMISAMSGPVGFSLNEKGFLIGGDHMHTGISTDFAMYDPVTDTWEQKNPLPVYSEDGAVFVLNNEAYHLVGSNTTKEFFKYAEQTDTWLRAPDFPGLPRRGGAYFSINGKGYIAGGVIFPDGSSDTWEYNPSCPANILNRLSVVYSADTPFCYVAEIDTIKGDSVQYAHVSYTWLQSTDGITYQTIPNSNNYYISNLTLTQSTYFKRVAYCNADCFDTAPPIKITISNIDTTLYITPSSFVCSGDTVKLANYHRGRYKHWTIDGEIVHYNWSPSVRIPHTFDTLLATRSGLYKVFNFNQDGCADSTEVDITILSLNKNINFTPGVPCPGDSVKIANYEQGDKRWYRNDTLLLTGQGQPYAFDSFITHITGTYWLAIERSGCRDTSLKYRLSHLPEPEPVIVRQENVLYTAETYQSYAWYDAQDSFTGDSDSHFYPDQNGNYYVVVTNRYGCTGMSDLFPFEKEEEEQTGISLPDFRRQIVIFPNPAHSLIHIETGGLTVSGVTLLDVYGRKLRQTGPFSGKTMLSLEELPTGIYYLEINDGTTLLREKVVKQAR